MERDEQHIISILEGISCDLKKLCRVCLKDNIENKYSIYDRDGDTVPIFECIMLVSNLKISGNEDRMPTALCEECKNQLNVINDFRLKCEYSDRILRKVLFKEQSPELKHEKCLDIIVKEEKTCDSASENIPLVEQYPNVKKKHKKIKKPKLESITLTNVLDNIKREVDDDYSLNDETHIEDDVELFTDNYVTNSQIKRVACGVCNKLFKSKRSLENHVEKYHGNQTVNYRVPYQIQGYGNERQFLCSFCNYTSKRKQGIMGHIRTHTGEKPFECDECKMHFPTSSALCNHKKIHSDQKNHTCPQCGKQFRMKSKYEIHKSVHSNEKNFQCNICNKWLKSKTTLQAHIFRHNNIKNYSCETCGATFVTCSELISHSKSHGGEKKFKCTICMFMTQTKAALDAHLLRHSGERKFECTQCDTKCYTIAALKNHMIKHTKEKKYSCMFCQQKFAHSSSLNRHMFKSHEKKCRWTDLVDRRIVK